ncbi:hypothetical protein HHL21_12710 [Massilia sp. RP-1-19]|uniref:Uncharacterized protein n=1 Tax=Massilia polaris TaxID=2728846 RepID=A0A848HRJ7_9BURK|nr:hypothetical protein [Massilia polaris]NML61923.1 hypothetical protein [Massilia polaris]
MKPAPFSTTPITIADAQQDMRSAYYSGAPGIMSSALVWFTAGMVALHLSAAQAVWTLLIGGMFIHPAAVVFNKMLGRSGKHNPSNPLGALGMASTFWMIMCLLLAYGVSMMRIEWFFPAVLLIIGGRYLTFSTLYGMRIYWACGAALALAAYPLAVYGASPATGAFAGAGIEAAFAVAVFLMSGRTTRGAAGAAGT